jgi:hypothetical protein
MVATRLDQQTEYVFTGAIADMETDLNQLKSGVQYVEPKLYDLSTTNTYDISGTFTASSLNTLVVQLIITVQSTDSTPLLATFIPVVWMDNTTAPYVDVMTNAYAVTKNIQVSDDPTKVSYFINVITRNTISSGFWLKIYCYASSPGTMTITRTV